METKKTKIYEIIKKAVRDKRIVLDGIRTGKTTAEMEKQGVVFYCLNPKPRI